MARKRIDALTDADRELMPRVRDEWIARGLDTTPVDRAVVENGMRRCYEAAGIPWHGNVVWVRSPLTVAFAGPIAARPLSGGAVGGAVDGAVHGAVDGAVDGAVGDAVGDAVYGAVGDAVGDAVDGAVGDAVHGAVRGAVHGAVGDAVYGAVGDAVDGAVRGAVGDAVYGAVDGNWYRYIGGQWWAGGLAWRDYFQQIGLDLDCWHFHTAYSDANQAGWWWPHRQFVVVAERPSELHRERVGPDGWGSHRLHNPDGPSIAWGNEWRLHHWHGVNVPEWVITGPTLDKIAAETNTEIRRCAIEAYGWGRYLTDLGVPPCDVAADPGNPGHTLALYHPPAEHQPYGEPVRLLVMSNASLDRDGTRRMFAETVPADIPDAVSAAAWQFGVDRATYATLERAT